MNGTIKCQGLSKQYKEVQALHPLDLEIPGGSIFGFLGRNGAGKTTTIRLMTGLARPTAGKAWVAGVETTRVDSAARLNFGYLPQDPSFYNWMTPTMYLGYIADLFEMPSNEKKQRIGEMLELVGLQDAAKRKIHGFSGGMQQRLGIAQAMLHKPSVLFLDEPTSALDPNGRYELLTLIENLRGQVTVFLSSHILGDIERVCDTIGIIQNGKLVTVAGRDELLARYAVDAISLTLDDKDVACIEPFTQTLQAQSWVTAVTPQAPELTIHVNDTAVAKQGLLPLVVQQNITLLKYEWVRPSLEDIFLHIQNNS